MIPPKRKTNAFTLIEFLVVSGIISIISGVVIFTFIGLKPTLQLNGSVRELVTDLRYTQQMAITEQIEYCLRFFLLEKKYQIIQCENETVVSDKNFPPEIENISISGFSNNEARFNPYGAVKNSGTIILENTKSNTKIIEVKPSGFVKVIN